MPSAVLASPATATSGEELRLAHARGETLGRGPVVGPGEEGDVVARGEGGTAELPGGREAVLGALGHRPAHHLVEGRRQAGDDLARNGRPGLEVRLERRLLVAGGERRAAGQGVEEDAPERVDVGAGVKGLAADLLGGEVGEGAGPAPVGPHGPRPVDGQAEVAEVDVLVAVRIGDEDVRRLHVPVHQVAGVGGVEGIADPRHDAGRAARRDPLGGLGDQVLEARPLDEAHGDEELSLVVAGAVDREDVGVLERGGRRATRARRARAGGGRRRARGRSASARRCGPSSVSWAR